MLSVIPFEMGSSTRENGIWGEGLSFSETERSSAAAAGYHVTNFYGPVTHAQWAQGANAVAQMAIDAPLNVPEIIAIIGSLRAIVDEPSLGSDRRAELSADIDTIEVQAKSPNPKALVIRESLSSIKRILEAAATSVATSAATAAMSDILARIVHLL